MNAVLFINNFNLLNDNFNILWKPLQLRIANFYLRGFKKISFFSFFKIKSITPKEWLSFFNCAFIIEACFVFKYYSL